jgi:rhamnosyltransferase subunit B
LLNTSKILLTTWGSFGDLHPFLALAIGLQSRGHRVLLVANPLYEEKVTAEGIAFAPLRPDTPIAEDSPELMGRVMHPRTGTKAVITELMMPALRDTYRDLEAASLAFSPDLLITHSIVYAGPILAEKYKIPFLSTALQPILFVSSYDPPVPPSLPNALWIRKMPRPLIQWGITQSQRRIRAWGKPIDALRNELGLPPVADPIFTDQFSPLGTLALFSEHFAPAQPDWPLNTTLTGFPFYDKETGGDAPLLAPEIERFLAAGSAPLLFTLGTSAVYAAGSFWQESAQAVHTLGERAIFLAGKNPPPITHPNILLAHYAPHSLLMPRCKAIIHQCGIGTTGQALRAGRPQLCVPFSHDQPDNAARLERLGVALRLPQETYRAKRATTQLWRLLTEADFATRAEALGEKIRAEDGVGTACNTIEKIIEKTISEQTISISTGL